MKALFGSDQLVAEYIEKGMGVKISPPYVGIGFTRDGTSLCGGALFNDWTGSNIEVSTYGPGSCTRYCMGVICRYAFKQIKVNRLTARTKRSNKLMRKLLPHIGFSFEGTQKRYFGPSRDDDALVFVLFPENAEKWIN